MKYNLFLFVVKLVLIKSSLATTQEEDTEGGHFDCVHDQMMQKYGPPEVQKDYEDKNHNRILQSTKQAIRITFDYSSLDDLANTIPDTYLKKKEAIIKATDTAKHFFQNLLKVTNRQTNNIFTGSATTCGSKTIPTADKTTGIANSDLHIYITFETNSAVNYLAYAGSCLLSTASYTGYYGPAFGYLNYNLYYVFTSNMDGSNMRFHYDLQTIKHELMHIIAFDYGMIKNYFIDPATGQRYTDKTRIISTETYGANNYEVLKTPFVLEAARNHYNCPTLPGMPLENEGVSAKNHWLRPAIYNEIMNPADHINSAFSYFTIALLKDSGFYQVKDDVFDQINWGKGKGCNFIQLQCTDSVNYPEFCYSTGDKCDLENLGGSFCQSSQTQCKGYQPYMSANCVDETKNSGTIVAFQKYGYNSRCFLSDFRPLHSSTTQKFRCYNYTCENQNSQIKLTVGTELLTCTTPGQVLTVSNLDGSLTCPDNFQMLCKTQFCPNLCSKNGYCFGNQCTCLFGMTGSDCSLCAQNQYKNNQNVCVSCHSTCLTCSSGLETNCQSCTQGLTLVNGVCTLPVNQNQQQQQQFNPRIGLTTALILLLISLII